MCVYSIDRKLLLAKGLVQVTPAAKTACGPLYCLSAKSPLLAQGGTGGDILWCSLSPMPGTEKAQGAFGAGWRMDDEPFLHAELNTYLQQMLGSLMDM